jgi:hypothetical protein
MTDCLAGVTTDGHCCWIDGEVCLLLRDDGPLADRRWVCTLRERLGSWQAVHRDPAYLAVARPTMARLGTDCGDWPGPGVRCGECGVTG